MCRLACSTLLAGCIAIWPCTTRPGRFSREHCRDAAIISTATHPDLAESLSNLAVLLYKMGEYAHSQSLIEEAISVGTAVHGQAHPVVAANLNSLAAILRERGQYEEAEQQHLEAIRMLRATTGEDDPRLGLFFNDLVATLEQAGEIRRRRRVRT